MRHICIRRPRRNHSAHPECSRRKVLAGRNVVGLSRFAALRDIRATRSPPSSVEVSGNACSADLVSRSRECDHSSQDVSDGLSYVFVLSSKLHGRGHSDKHAEHLLGVCLQQTCSPPTTRILDAGGLKEQKRRPNAGRRQRFRSQAASHTGQVAPCLSCVRRAVDLDRAHDRRTNGLGARIK